MSYQNQSTVYCHAARPEWGGAVIAWERDGKRGYQFEDGRQRVFTVAHYHLLEQIDASADRIQTLRAQLGLPAVTAASAPTATPGAPPTLDEQIAYFVATLPGGFTGEAWRDDHRGGGRRALKRHRDPAIALARKELTSDHLTSFIDRSREVAGVEVLASVLGHTDLVEPTDVRRLRALPSYGARVILIGVFDLLFARSTVEIRIAQWVQALTRASGQKADWGLATAPLALVFPEEHISVHRASFAGQAISMELRPKMAPSPTGAGYLQILSMVGRVRERLNAMRCAPADLLDVRDFIAFTLRGDARREISARRS